MAVLVLTGCATKSDVRELEEQLLDAMARQERMIEDIQRLVEATQDSVGANATSLFDIRGDTNRQLLDIQDQIITLQELAGQSTRNLAAMRDQLERQRAQAVMPPMGEPVPGGEGDGDDSARQLFNAGVTNFNRGSLGTASRAFEQFLQAYPSHALAPEAQYYLGDIMVQESRLDEGIEAFGRIAELYPTADAVPRAIYRIGLLQHDMGDTDEAIASFERVVNTYPESDVAQLAQERLSELR